MTADTTPTRYSPDKNGFLSIRNANDLLKKAQHDFGQLKSNHQNPWLAFNFFVTAHHIADWAGMVAERKSNPLLQVCRHIADGAKHFSLDDKRHTLVLDLVDKSYVEFDYVEPGYYEEEVEVELANENGLVAGTTINVIDLAEQILDFWMTKLAQSKVPS